MLKKWYLTLVSQDDESLKLLSFVKKFAKAHSKILDVGCGYGRYLIPLKNLGYDVLGVEQNQSIVNENIKNGLRCETPDEFDAGNEEFDVIILSHIIEHFSPDNLLSFLDKYLAKLKIGGHLIIATPLYTQHFYDDFDHVKPYHPVGFQMVYGGTGAQVQYYAKHTLALCDIWFRRSPYFSVFHRAKYVKSFKTRLLQIYDAFVAIVFKMSFGMIGKKDGWIGVYQKQ